MCFGVRYLDTLPIFLYDDGDTWGKDCLPWGELQGSSCAWGLSELKLHVHTKWRRTALMLIWVWLRGSFDLFLAHAEWEPLEKRRQWPMHRASRDHNVLPVGHVVGF